MSNSFVKLTFFLTKDQMANYPVDRESIWCDKEGDHFRVKNIPLFIDELSYDDLISVIEIEENLFQITSVVGESKNSTLWVFIKNSEDGEAVLDQIKSLGCKIEGGVLNGYYALNVPQHADIQKIYTVIDVAETEGVLVADYPSIRHA